MLGALQWSTLNQYQSCWLCFQQFQTAGGSPSVTEKVLDFISWLIQTSRRDPATVIARELADPLMFGFNISISNRVLFLICSAMFIVQQPVALSWSLHIVL